jgi:uncharacterized membrane protein YidH (DUF202 family)
MSEQTGVDATRRTRLANERTFLAWWRTALGTLGLAVAVGKILPEVTAGRRRPRRSGSWPRSAACSRSRAS